MLTPYYEPVRGGITSYVKGLSDALRERGAHITVLTREGQAATDVEVPSTHSRDYVRQTCRILAKIRPDVVHAHGHWYALSAAASARDFGVSAPVVYSFHTPWSLPSHLWFRRILRSANAITVPNRRMKRTVSAWLGTGRNVHLVHPATDVRQPPTARVEAWCKRFGIPEGSPVLAFVGPLHYPKKVRGVRNLIRAAAALRSQYSDLKVVIVGNGKLRGTVESEARREAPGSVIFTGSVPDPSLLLSRATLYTHISYLEGFPMAVLEAMALGRCVVATKTGGIPEVIEDGKNGVLVEGSPRDIAVAVRDLLEDIHTRERIGRAAVETIRRQYRWEFRAIDFLEIYTSG